MKKLLHRACAIMATGLLSLFSMTSCVDENYDLSKDVDMTLGVGKGLSLPIGSTEKIYLSDFIDTASVDVLSMDRIGNYIIGVSDEFNTEPFEIGNMNLIFKPSSVVSRYDFTLESVATDNYDSLPKWMKEQLTNTKYPYVLRNEINSSTTLDIYHDDIPKDIKRLVKTDFKEPVYLNISLRIYSRTHESDALLESTNKIYFSGKNDEGFAINVPEFLIFSKNENVKDGKIVLNGKALYDNNTKALHYNRSLRVDSIDFSKTDKGYLDVVDGVLQLSEDVSTCGLVESDTVFFDSEGLSKINEVDVETTISLSLMKLNNLTGLFEPKLESLSEVIDLNLGEKMEFMNNAYLDVRDPRIYFTFDNPIEAKILVDANFVGLDSYSNPMEHTRMDADVTILAGTTSKILFNRYEKPVPGWANCCIPNMNELIKTVPDKVSVSFDAKIATDTVATISLGKDLSVSGSYNMEVPLAFDSLKLEYIYTIDNVLGDGEILNTVKDINGVTLSFNVKNTIPLGLAAEIYPYDENGVFLSELKMEIDGEIGSGPGYTGEDNPVESNVEVKISAHSGEIEKLSRIDIMLHGTGHGALNANEYLQLTDISLRLDDYISIDLNQ